MARWLDEKIILKKNLDNTKPNGILLHSRIITKKKFSLFYIIIKKKSCSKEKKNYKNKKLLLYS